MSGLQLRMLTLIRSWLGKYLNTMLFLLAGHPARTPSMDTLLAKIRLRLSSLTSLLVDSFTSYCNADFIDSFPEHVSHSLSRTIARLSAPPAPVQAASTLQRQETSYFAMDSAADLPQLSSKDSLNFASLPPLPDTDPLRPLQSQEEGDVGKRTPLTSDIATTQPSKKRKSSVSPKSKSKSRGRSASKSTQKKEPEVLTRQLPPPLQKKFTFGDLPELAPDPVSLLQPALHPAPPPPRPAVNVKLESLDNVTDRGHIGHRRNTTATATNE